MTEEKSVAESLVIETEEQSEAALKEIEALMIRNAVEKDLTPEEMQRLKVLVEAESAYESKMFPTEYIPPKELLEHLMEANDLNIKKLSKQSGVSKRSIAAFLQGGSLTESEGIRLAKRFCLRQDFFLETEPKDTEVSQ